MVTELYMVEKWERAVINTLIILVFALLSYFNYTVLLYYTTPSYKALPAWQDLKVKLSTISVDLVELLSFYQVCVL